MAETALKPLKAILETIREQADFALKQLQNSEEERSMRWKCKDCRYIKHFTWPVALEAAGKCPRCKSLSFIWDSLKQAGWSLGYVSTLETSRRTTWIVDAHRNDERFVVRSDEKLTAFLELERSLVRMEVRRENLRQN